MRATVALPLGDPRHGTHTAYTYWRCRCELCREARRVWHRAWRNRDRNRQREYVRKTYGLTLEEYDALLAMPCAICGAAADGVDHCHDTGLVRGPLCRSCNSGLGFFKESPELIRVALAYLEAARDGCVFTLERIPS